MTTTRITRRELLCENLVETWTIEAKGAAQDRYEAESLVLAPYTYAQLKAANVERKMGALLAELSAHLVRAQAVRFLVERKAATGAAWGWGDVDAVAATFERLVEVWQDEQRALAQLELAGAVHSEACVSAESYEEFAEARELEAAKADVYFERRLIRERLEAAAFAPVITLGYVRAIDQELADQRQALDEAATELEAIAARVEALLPVAQAPGDDADQIYIAALPITDALFDLAGLCRTAIRAL